MSNKVNGKSQGQQALNFTQTKPAMTMFCAGFFIKGIKKYEVIHKNSKNEIINSTQAESFFILKELGNKYFENKDYINALREFELAYAIDPENGIKLKLLTCYENLCESDLSYCDKYNDLLNEN